MVMTVWKNWEMGHIGTDEALEVRRRRGDPGRCPGGAEAPTLRDPRDPRAIDSPLPAQSSKESGGPSGL